MNIRLQGLCNIHQILRHLPKTWRVTSAIALLFTLLKPVVAAETNHWKTGPDFQRQLMLPTGISWVGMPLRRGLVRLASNQQVFIFLDRRINPDRRMNLSVREASLEKCLHEIAGYLDAECCYLNSIVYMGPVETAKKLPTLAAVMRQELEALSPPIHRRLLYRRPWQWDALTTPRDLLHRLSRELRIPIEGIEKIPHDLWPGVELPPMTGVDRLLLITAGFDKTFQLIDKGSKIQIVRMPSRVSLTKLYRLPSHSNLVIQRLRDRFPDARFDVDGHRLVVDGSWTVHCHVRETLFGMGRPLPTQLERDRTVYDLKVVATVHDLLKTASQERALELIIDTTAAQKVRERVDVEVRRATFNELLRAILDPVKLNFRIDMGKLFVGPYKTD